MGLASGLAGDRWSLGFLAETEDQVEHLFETFRRGWNFQSRLEAVLDYYARWKGQG